MRARWTVLLVIFSVAQACMPGLALAQESDKPTEQETQAEGRLFPRRPEAQVDKQEILRRGDMVEHITGPIGGPVGVDIDDPLATPPDDNHKWFISTYYRQAEAGRLTAAWRATPELLAFADPHDPEKSWAHFTQYNVDEKSQEFKRQQLRFAGYPTVVVQPPLTGQWGDPGTVVCQTVYDGDPRKLATTISEAIKLYVGRMQGGGAYRQHDAGQCPWGPCPGPTPDPNTPQPYGPAPGPNQFPFQIPPVDAAGSDLLGMLLTAGKYLLVAFIVVLVIGVGLLVLVVGGMYLSRTLAAVRATERGVPLDRPVHVEPMELRTSELRAARDPQLDELLELLRAQAAK